MTIKVGFIILCIIVALFVVVGSSIVCYVVWARHRMKLIKSILAEVRRIHRNGVRKRALRQELEYPDFITRVLSDKIEYFDTTLGEVEEFYSNKYFGR